MRKAFLFLSFTLTACGSTIQVGGSSGSSGSSDGGSGGAEAGGSSGALPGVDAASTPAADAGPHGTLGPPDAKRMFVTSTAYAGNNLYYAGGGTAASPSNDEVATAIDNLCGLAAKSVGMGGTWRAWISAGVDAIDRIADVPGGWYNVDRTAHLFANKSALATQPDPREWAVAGAHDGEGYVSMVKDEYGQPATQYGRPAKIVWTGTGAGGRSAEQNCERWTTAGGYGTNGVVEQSPTDWTITATAPCSVKYSLYCFEQ